MSKYCWDFFLIISVVIALLVPPPVPASNYFPSQTLAETPYEMLVMGDSIVWGQGLEPEQKFTTLVRKDIEGLLGRPVNVVDQSHSGATIKPKWSGSRTRVIIPITS